MAGAPVNSVVTTTMYGSQVDWIVGAAVSLLDQVVRRVGARLIADMADAVVAGDNRSREFAPRLRAVRSVNTITALTLRRPPTVWAVDRRLPWHGRFSRLGGSVWRGHSSSVAADQRHRHCGLQHATPANP